MKRQMMKSASSFGVFFIAILFLENKTSCTYLRGQGASFPYEVYKSWIPSYKAYRQRHVNLIAQYESVGSGAGKKAIKANMDIEYAGSDSLLSNDDRSNYPDLVEFPTMAGAIVMGYNFDLEQRLRLTREQIVGIYNGTYRYWNETTFQVTNPNSTMPNQRIIVIARADKSGTTDLFTGALSSFSSEWKDTYGQFSTGLNTNTDLPYKWNKSVITYYGNQNRGVSGLILSFRYSVGYLSVADSTEAKITAALVENGFGNFVEATSFAVQDAMDYFASLTNNLTFPLHNGQEEHSYPIAGFTHFIVYKTQMKLCDSAKEFVRYTYWCLTEESQRVACESAGMAPLSTIMVNRVKERVLKSLTCNGEKMWDKVLYDIENENKVVDTTWIIAVGVIVPILSLVVVALLGYIVFQRYKQWKVLNSDEWKIPIEEIVFYFDAREAGSHRSKLSKFNSLKSLHSSSNLSSTCAEDYEKIVSQVLQWPGKWKSYNIGLRILDVKQLHTINVFVKREMISIRDRIIHANVVRFFGLTEIENDRYIIGEYCAKGTLVDVLQDDKLNLTHDFKLALTLDTAHGMQFLHAQGVVHGNLTSSVCLVDTKWTVKISDWEFGRLFTATNDKTNPILEFRKNLPEEDGNGSNVSRDFWVAPEILRLDFLCNPTRESDVYSFAIIMQEIFTREEPYSEHYHLLSTKEILCRIQLNHLRPQTSLDIPISVRQVMEIAWTDNPLSRPSFDQICKMLKRSNPNRKSVIDSVMRSMEEYMDHLEERIEEKSSELVTARANIESILSSLVPAQFALKLANGQHVESVSFPSVGIIVVEVNDNDEEYQEMTPGEIVNSLNVFCQEIELLQKKYNVYIQSLSGNSLTLIVGVARENITVADVALHTAHMCLDIHNCAKKDSPNGSGFHLSLRIGAHTGPASGGMLGCSLPRYVVFGQVIDVSCALARSAIPTSPHISKVLWRSIEGMELFTSERAGLLTVKGCQHKTYWLTGRTEEFQSVSSETSEDSGLESQTVPSTKLYDNKSTECVDKAKPIIKKQRPSLLSTSHDKHVHRSKRRTSSKVHPSNDDVIVEVDDS